MAIDAGLGKKQRATAEMLNKWCLLPQFIHILMAHKYNVSIVEATKDPEVARLVMCAIRHHVHNHGFSNIGGHACMAMYDLQFTQCLGKDQTQLILAALYLTEIINATLTTIHDDDEHIGVKTRSIHTSQPSSVDRSATIKAPQRDKRRFDVIIYDEHLRQLPWH